jgi:hypothetical protein
MQGEQGNIIMQYRNSHMQKNGIRNYTTNRIAEDAEEALIFSSIQI